MSDRKRIYPDEISYPSSSRRRSGDCNLRDDDEPRRSGVATKEAKKYIRTNDEIHRSISICPVMKRFLDCPQFQRLRNLRQLSTASLVYNNATHSRHEHSLGVAHLAQRLVKHLQENQPNLGVTPRDILCIKLAGLLHDTGHGPYSHTFERFATKHFPKYFETLSKVDKERYENLPKIPKNFSHEDVSMTMIDAALAHYGFEIDPNNLDKPLKEIGGNKAESIFSFEPDGQVLTSRDFIFIKECIRGEPLAEIRKATGLQGFVGRPGWEKEWMYDIVSNRHSGLDVDKMDYFARDSRRCYGDGCVDEIVVEDAVVAWGECTDKDGWSALGNDRDVRPYPGKHLMICYPEKSVKALISFFNLRYKLHDTVYWHKTTAGAAHMVCDILCHADPYLWKSSATFGDKPFSAKSNRPEISLPMSRAGLDDRVFIRLGDDIIHEIANSTDKRMEKARNLACRFICRDLYKCPAEHSIDRQNPADVALWNMSEEEIKQRLLDTKGHHGTNANGCDIEVFPEDFIVEKYSIHHGQKDRNPIENVRVVGGTMMSKLNASPRFLPIAERPKIERYKAQTPIEQEQSRIRIFCRDATKHDLLSHVFAQWLQCTHDSYVVTSSCDSNGGAVAVSQSPYRPRPSDSELWLDDLDGPPQISLDDSS